MEQKLQRRVQRYGWDRAAPFYERYWETSLAPAQTATLKAAQLSPGESVIDVACGTGLLSFVAARQAEPDGRVLGSDISSNTVAAAESTAAAKGINAPGAKKSLESVMAEVGFRATSTTRIAVDLVYADDEEALGAAFLGGPVALAYGKFDEATKQEVHQEYLESIADYRDDSGAYRVPGEFVITSGVK
jgi:SAM-dependent methyltransferase